MTEPKNLTPAQIVAELDKYIIGQDDAKRAVAIALRNRWRRLQLPPDVRDDVAPKNILMVGPTGVGKTEIARRLAALVAAPFVKVEATKFTEIGYVGRDVDCIVRDLLERSLQMVRAELELQHAQRAHDLAQDRLLDALLPRTRRSPRDAAADDADQAQQRFERTRAKLREQLHAGALETREIEITVEKKAAALPIFSNVSLEQVEPEMQNFLEQLLPSRSVRRRLPVAEARKLLAQQELDKLIDHAKLIQAAIERAEQRGIVFLDEIDKICGHEGYGPDVSREGVQRDLLPLVEGATISTRHGHVRTDHVLFIAAGAFTRRKPSDLMPELQGRFPIRVQLKDLTQEHFRRILTEPRNALTIQQVALLATEGVELVFPPDGVDAMAQKAYEINKNQQNIGARRLYAVLEKVLEEISFTAPAGPARYVIDAAYVNERIRRAEADEDLNIFGFARRRADD